MTNISGQDGRAFVVPNILGESFINIGPDAFKDPIRHTNSAYREFGQILIHELTHVWQIHNTGLSSYMCAIRTQISDGPYEPGDGMKSWSEYNPEQQATMVDRWYGGGSKEEPCSTRARFYNHVHDTINGGNEPPVSQISDIRDVTVQNLMRIATFQLNPGFQYIVLDP